MPASPDEKKDALEHELFITNGVSHGLELLCATCTKPGDEVWVERPSYFLAPKIFESHGLVVKSLPMISDRTNDENDRGDAIGRVDIDRLVHMVEEESVPPPKMMYIIPSYHNPTGTLMTVEERRRLASFAVRNGVLIAADEVYHLLDWEQGGNREMNLPSRRPAGMINFNGICEKASTLTTNGNQREKHHEGRSGCCISVSSFTKIWAPGIRLGWIHAPSFIIERLKNYGYIDSQGGVAPFMGEIMKQAIELGLLDSYLDKLKSEYSERYELVYNMLKEEPRLSIAQNCQVRRQGGYFIWVQFPPGINSNEFLSYSIDKYEVKFMAGGRCDPFPSSKGGASGIAIRSCARLCFADLDRDNLVNATEAFLESFRSYMKSIDKCEFNI